jgi:glycosyltransferase involved in cell wall biosynthesis
LGLTDRVKFLSYVAYADLPKLINGAIGLVFVSLWEGFGLPVLEAMACGTPVITSNRSALPEVAERAALLVDPENIPEIADAMRSLIQQPPLRQELRQLGLDRATHFRWEKTSQLARQVLQDYV